MSWNQNPASVSVVVTSWLPANFANVSLYYHEKLQYSN